MKHAPRKRFGQHFLTDASVLAAIAGAVAPCEGERIVEIGPGLGALTEHLLAHAPRIDAVEIDRDLVARLRRRWPAERLAVHEGDALAFDFAWLAAAAGGPLRLVGNLPYNISSPLLIRLLGFREHVVDAHFMLQKEVIDRIVAPPGTAEFGRLGVMMQAFHRVERLFDVPPEAFEPPPRVDSSVMRMRPRPRPMVREAAALERLLAVAFAQRRKMLRGTLLPWLRTQGVDPEDPRFGLVPTARPEEIPVERWAALADALPPTRAGSAAAGGADPVAD
ncbi:MAG TPA: 16S rRNA (adenine(1518)-N(6)/adenine(1519)-N(6))-dimethyltransferase RsmA [Burkholderiaceae bacterium]|nr:16S rRNA (adenine(1518)-N(6)/adenine(1519)-N(6))-dimethyltransferase RsmA [Burkholderiaceae bacterium]